MNSHEKIKQLKLNIEKKLNTIISNIFITHESDRVNNIKSFFSDIDEAIITIHSIMPDIQEDINDAEKKINFIDSVFNGSFGIGKKKLKLLKTQKNILEEAEAYDKYLHKLPDRFFKEVFKLEQKIIIEELLEKDADFRDLENKKNSLISIHRHLKSITRDIEEVLNSIEEVKKEVVDMLTMSRRDFSGNSYMNESSVSYSFQSLNRSLNSLIKDIPYIKFEDDKTNEYLSQIELLSTSKTDKDTLKKLNSFIRKISDRIETQKHSISYLIYEKVDAKREIHMIKDID